MVSVSNLTVSFGGVPLYEDISFLINQRDRIGLAGKNGSGKSTLLKVLAGEQQPDKGDVSKPKNCTIGYLPQEMKHQIGRTVFEETLLAFSDFKMLEAKVEQINKELGERTDYESDYYMNLITELNEVNEKLHLSGAYSVEGDVEKTLLGLGFDREDFERQTSEFSGGWRMRIEIAKLLLRKPDLLLLDEPTNHLDIESIQWIEDLLKNYSGAVVMVSHDKAFLDNVTNRTLEISLGKIHDYNANYSRYLVLRKERKESQLNAAKNQQRFIDKTEALIDKYRAKANKASFAQSLIKKLEKIDVIEVDQDDTSSIRFYFPPAPRSGKVVVGAEGVTKAYGPKVIFRNVDYMIERGDRIAFVGRNGEGKSTMIKLIVGREKGEGKLQLGHNVSVGYFAQDQADLLDENKTVFQTIDEAAVGEIRRSVRNLLGSFLFSGDDIDKKVKVLSGGEKGRLAMCKLLLEPYSLLVLDEPTNHLDIRSKEVLKNALMKYDGTLVVVSHDRDFLQGLTNKVYEFRNKTVKQHFGDVNEYLSTRKIETLQQLEKKEVVKKKEEAARPVQDNNNDAKKTQEKEIKQLENKIRKSEEQIKNLETQIKEFDDKLQDPEKYSEVVNDKEAFARYEQLKKTLEAEMSSWEALVQDLEQISK